MSRQPSWSSVRLGSRAALLAAGAAPGCRLPFGGALTGTVAPTRPSRQKRTRPQAPKTTTPS